MTLSLKTDSNGQVFGFRYHDGNLAGVYFSPDGSIEIAVASTSGDVSTLKLTGVRHFLANEVREGNVVDRIFLWPLGHAPEWVQTKLRDEIHVARLKAADGLQLFYLECSYGAEVTAVVTAMTLVERESS